MVVGRFKLQARKSFEFLSATLVIKQYLNNTPWGKRKLILGGHWSDQKGWLILNESHQDITKKLKLPTNSFDVIFLEHVFEHIEFDDAIFFLKEARRVLRPGGILRIVSPFLERIMKTTFNKNSKKDKSYIQNILIKLNYPELNNLVKSIGLNGIFEDPQMFFLNAIFRENDHKFIWSAKFLTLLMNKLKFNNVKIYRPGYGHKKEYCLERKQRGVYMGLDRKKDAKAKSVYDIESLAVEGTS